MIRLLAGLFIKNKEDIHNSAVRQSYGMLCGAVGIFLNICLFTIKLLAGMLSGSIAITADAFNNLSDAGSSVITLVGFKMAGQKADSDHPFGHGRIEYLSGFLVSVIILIMGFELLKSSVEKVLHPQPVDTSGVVFLILIISILVKIYMSIYNRQISKKIDSAAMEATAKDSINDSISTMVVLVATFVTYLFQIQIDGYCGVAVALFVFWSGFQAAKDTISPLLGQPPEKEFVQKIEQIVMEYKEDGVLGLHDLVVHNYGPGRVMLSVHVEVPASGDILELHDMIDLIERRLAKELDCSAVIHMDPVCVDDEKTMILREMVAELIQNLDTDMSFHDFRIVEGPTHTNLIFDVVIPYHCSKSDEAVVTELQEEINQINTNFFAVINVDRDFT